MVAGHPVPKSKRARSLALAGASAHYGHLHHPHAAASSFTSTSAGTPPRTTDYTAALVPIAHQGQESMYRAAALPTEVKAHAVFQCVRMTGLATGQEEFAYRTIVRIGGRTFKGLLHDQGPSDRLDASAAELQLGGRSSAPLSSSALIDLAGIYGTAPGNPLLGKESMPGPF